MSDHVTDENIHEEVKLSAARMALMRKALLYTPHGLGDHTDRCRMENGGAGPGRLNDCICHVALIDKALDTDKCVERAFLELYTAVRHLLDNEECCDSDAHSALRTACEELERHF
ncbi:MAG: hypothetical protein HQL50_01045 [Magnetococcales bacterium]|nr:hypothetical protein [Magnetococcales bacterium]